MAGQNVPPAQDQTGSLDFLWGAVAFVIAVLVVWFVFKDFIVSGILTLKFWELEFIRLFTADVDPLMPIINYYRENPHHISYPLMKDLLTDAGVFFSIPVAIIMLLLAGVLYFSSFATQYRHIHNMNTLYESEKKLWPQIMPVAKEDLLKTPINEGPWAMAQNPMEFAKKHNLLREVHERGTGAKLIDRGMKVRAEIIRDKAEHLFVQQLGPLWESVDKLNDYTKALYAAFVSRANHDRDTSRKLLDQISASSPTGKLDFSGVDKILEKYKDCKKAAKVVSEHAYVYTVMASMLELARTDGVLSSADFLWLKPRDRMLWYILNNVGRQTAFVEVSGVFAHWLVEKELHRKLSVPMIHEAVTGLEKSISMVIYQPEEKA